MKLRIVVLIALLSVGLTADGLASTAEPMSTAAISFTNPHIYTNNQDGGGIGFLFTPDMDMVVNQLGFFDDDGFDGDHFVGLYASDGSYLASTTVTGSDSMDAFFRYATIEPLTLTAGTQYIILGEAGSDNYVDNASYFTATGIQFMGDAFYYLPAAAENLDLNELDSLLDGQIGFFGPNFRYVPVPVPGGIWLLGSGLLFLIGRKKSSPIFS